MPFRFCRPSSGAFAFTDLEIDWPQPVGDCSEQEDEEETDCIGHLAIGGAWELDLDTATGLWQ